MSLVRKLNLWDERAVVQRAFTGHACSGPWLAAGAATALGPIDTLHRTTGIHDGHRGGLPGQASVLGRDGGKAPP